MSSRKRFFQDLENEGTSTAAETFTCENINTEMRVDKHTSQDVDILDEFATEMGDHQQSANYKISKRTIFFEHLGDEGTSVDPRIKNDQVNSNFIADERTSASGNISNENENTIATDVLENSFSFGQAVYQKAKQGMIIQYKDHGDNAFQCVHCNAYYWRDEKNTRGIYTGCCQQGQFDCFRKKTIQIRKHYYPYLSVQGQHRDSC